MRSRAGHGRRCTAGGSVDADKSTHIHHNGIFDNTLAPDTLSLPEPKAHTAVNMANPEFDWQAVLDKLGDTSWGDGALDLSVIEFMDD